MRLDKAYQAFFKKIMRYPKFRTGKYNSFTYQQWGGWKIFDNKLLLSHIGAIKFKMHRTPVGTLKRCTIIREIDRWYCCITVEDYFTEQKPIERAVGIDRGIENLMALNTGEMVENPRFLKAAAAKITELQRTLSRKKEDSKNREKARIQLAKAWRRVRNQRLDYCHKESARFDTRI